MRKRIAIFALGCLLPVMAQAQVTLRTEYIGKSGYRDMDNNKTGGRGDALVITGAVQLPLSVAVQDDGRIKAWAASLYSSYTSFNNDAMQGLAPEKIFDNRAGIVHIRPFSRKWSVMASLGVGTYAGHTHVGRTRFEEVLFDGALLFIWHLRPNLDLGFGLAINSSFGYPMGFPAFYLKWTASGKYFVQVQMLDGANVSAGIHLGRSVSLGLVTDMNGSMALERVQGKKTIFTHSYITVALQPEVKIGRNLTFSVRGGFCAVRNAYYEERTLKAFFKGFGREYDPHFDLAPYFSAGMNISF